jgi:RNA polymerase sigma-70 factor (ECF subfamily)
MRSASKGLPIVGDSEAFEAFYLRHFDRVTVFLARRTDDPHEVADLTAEVFLAALESAHTYRPDLGGEVGWLYGVARNVLNAERRRRDRRRGAAQRLNGRRLLEDDDVAELIDRIDACAPARAALAAMAALPKGQRDVLELVAVDALSVGEAASVLRIDVNAARVRLHRARKALAQVPGVSSVVMEGRS